MEKGRAGIKNPLKQGGERNMNKGDKIKINYGTGKHTVTVLKVLEKIGDYTNGQISGFVKVKFETGKIKNVVIWK